MSNINGFRIRFQEAGGSQLKNMFSTDLAKGTHCGRTSCPPCDGPGEKKENCRSKTSVYESCCTVCNQSTNASQIWCIHWGNFKIIASKACGTYEGYHKLQPQVSYCQSLGQRTSRHGQSSTLPV